MNGRERISVWFARLLESWRAALETASESVRPRVLRSPSDLSAPTQGDFYVRGDESSPVRTAVLVLRHDVGSRDGEVRCWFDDGREAPTGDAPPREGALTLLEDRWRAMRTNWVPDRPADPPAPPWHIARMHGEGDVSYWLFPCDPTIVGVAGLVSHLLREEEAPPARIRRPPPEPHIFEAGMDRERTAVRRWMALHAAEMMNALGLHGPFWCGLFVPRSHVFGERLDGDVDILAGPVEFEVSPGEWERRLADESRAHPLSTSRSLLVQFAVTRAAAAGLLRWPPAPDLVVACEAKASWYQPPSATWKATHRGEAVSVKGQLQLLLDRGVDRVGFLHLTATEPGDHPDMNPWMAASVGASMAEDSLFEIYPPSELASVGYFSSVLGSVPFALEHHAGAGGGLRVHQPGTPNSLRAIGWRDGLRGRLAALPRPLTVATFLTTCDRCGRWNWQPDVTASTCECSASPAATL